MRCSEAWKPIENCFDPISLECVDSQTVRQISAFLTRTNLAEREFLNTKDAQFGERAWRFK